MLLADIMTAGHLVRCGKCGIEIPAGQEFHWGNTTGTTCLGCAKEGEVQAEITISEQMLNGMALAVGMASERKSIMQVIQKFEDLTGLIPAVCLGMSEDDALAALHEAISEENAQRETDDEILVVASP